MKNLSGLTTITIISILLVAGLALGVSGRTVVDGLGRRVTVDEVPEKIVTTIVSTTEIALDLGLSDKLVGVTSLTRYLSYVPELQKQAEKIEGLGEFNISLEKIATLDPDLALVDGSAQKDLVKKIENLGVTVYATTADSIREVKEDILRIGHLTGTVERATEIVGDMTYKQLMLELEVAQLKEKKKVFYTVSKQMYTTGSNTFVGQGLKAAGLDNVFSGISGWKPASNEEIVNRNPEVIIASEDMGLDVSSLKEKPGFEKLRAVQEENVLLLSYDANSMLNQPGTKVVDGVINLFEMVYDREVEFY